jgi:hypothetical protein
MPVAWLFLRKPPLINTLLWLGVTVPLGFPELLQQFFANAIQTKR